MRVAMFSESYKPFLNGQVILIINAKKALERRRNKVYVFTSGKDIKEKNVFFGMKLNLSQGYGISVPYYDKKRIIEKCDIFHTHQPFLLGLYALYKSRKYKKPLVMTNNCQYHEYAIHYIPIIGRSISKIVTKYVGWFINRCDKVILPSNSFKESLIKEYGVMSKKITVLPNFINPPSKINTVKRKIISKKYKLKNKKVLIYVGRIGREKNIEFVIKSFGKVCRARNDVVLFIVGGGPDLENLKNLAKELKIENKVYFIGYVMNKDVFVYLSLADIFVSASKSEIHPLTLLEAMHCGVVPIAFKSAVGFVDTIENMRDGILVGKEKISEYSKAILNLLENEESLRTMKTEARNKSKEYSMNKIIDRLVSLYASLIKN